MWLCELSAEQTSNKAGRKIKKADEKSEKRAETPFTTGSSFSLGCILAANESAPWFCSSAPLKGNILRTLLWWHMLCALLPSLCVSLHCAVEPYYFRTLLQARLNVYCDKLQILPLHFVCVLAVVPLLSLLSPTQISVLEIHRATVCVIIQHSSDRYSRCLSVTLCY